MGFPSFDRSHSSWEHILPFLDRLATGDNKKKIFKIKKLNILQMMQVMDQQGQRGESVNPLATKSLSKENLLSV